MSSPDDRRAEVLVESLRREAARRQDDAPAVAHDLRRHASEVQSAAIALRASKEYRPRR